MKYKGEPTCDWTLLENPGTFKVLQWSINFRLPFLP